MRTSHQFGAVLSGSVQRDSAVNATFTSTSIPAGTTTRVRAPGSGSKRSLRIVRGFVLVSACL